MLDKNNHNSLSREELRSLVDLPATRIWFEILDVDMDDLYKLFDALDDGDGQIDEHEFIEGLQSMKGPAHRMDVVHLRKLVLKIFHRLNDKVDESAMVAQFDKAKECGLRTTSLWSRKIQRQIS